MIPRRSMGRRVVALSASFLVASTLAVSAQPRPATDPRGEVEAALREYARLQKLTDAAGLSAFYTPDGELLEPGMESLRGPAAVRKFLESFTGVRVESASMDPEATEVCGSLAVQWGNYAQRVTVPGQPVGEYRGRFVVQWSRQPSGRWLIRRLLTQPAM